MANEQENFEANQRPQRSKKKKSTKRSLSWPRNISYKLAKFEALTVELDEALTYYTKKVRSDLNRADNFAKDIGLSPRRKKDETK